jgi:hypothetical protein
MDYEKENYDVEKNPGTQVFDDGAVPGETFEHGTGLIAKMHRLAGRFGVEQRGIERVPENERTDTSLVNVGTMVGHRKSSPFENIT